MISLILPAKAGFGKGSLVERKVAGWCIGCFAARCELFAVVLVLVLAIPLAASSFSFRSINTCLPKAAVSLTIGAGGMISSSGRLRFLA